MYLAFLGLSLIRCIPNTSIVFFHPHLLYKLNRLELTHTFPQTLYLVFSSSLWYRYFIVRIQQLLLCGGGSIFGRLLCTLDTADAPDTLHASFADANAILTSDPNPNIVAAKLQLNAIEYWCKKCCIKLNDTKSHLHRKCKQYNCPEVFLNTQL